MVNVDKFKILLVILAIVILYQIMSGLFTPLHSRYIAPDGHVIIPPEWEQVIKQYRTRNQGI